MAMNKCPKCSSSQIDTGKIVSAGAIGYQSGKQRNPFKAGQCVTYVCLACGYTETFVDADYREKIKGMHSSAGYPGA